MIQVYYLASGAGSPRELRGFEIFSIIQSGKNTKVTVMIKLRDLAYWDVDEQKWVVAKGVYKTPSWEECR